MEVPLINAAIISPLVGALALVVVPRRMPNLGRMIAVAASFVCLVFCVALFAKVGAAGEIEQADLRSWIPSLGIYYRVGFDGVSAMMACVVSLICTCAIVVSWQETGPRRKMFGALALLAEAGLIGLFAAIDAFLFFLFWNLATICACFIAGMWGGPSRIKTSFKYAAFAAVSGGVMLAAFAYAGGSAESFCFVDWMAQRFSIKEQAWLFGALALSFGIFVPIIGLHTWLADFCEETPASCAMIPGSAMLVAAAYGFFRIAMPLAPVAVAVSGKTMLVLFTAQIFMGAMLAMSERDMRRIVAAASISQMGVVMVGLFSLQGQAAAGAMTLAAVQALICAALYATAGMLKARFGTCDVGGISGLGRAMPAMALALAVLAAAAAGIPGLAGFSAQFQLLMGAFQARTGFAVAALAGLALFAIAMARMTAGAVFGHSKAPADKRPVDVRASEASAILPIIAVVVLLGVWPQPVMEKVGGSADAFVKLAKRVEMIIPASPDAGGESEGSGATDE